MRNHIAILFLAGLGMLAIGVRDAYIWFESGHIEMTDCDEALESMEWDTWVWLKDCNIDIDNTQEMYYGTDNSKWLHDAYFVPIRLRNGYEGARSVFLRVGPKSQLKEALNALQKVQSDRELNAFRARYSELFDSYYNIAGMARAEVDSDTRKYLKKFGGDDFVVIGENWEIPNPIFIVALLLGGALSAFFAATKLWEEL